MNTEEARQFNSILKTAFAPVNPAVAHQITENCGITKGTAIDIGSGPGHLAIELARLTSLTIYALDISEAMFPIATENIQKAGLSDRIIPVTGNVMEMPFADASADLIISKGSVFFWEDTATAFQEIQRVLTPGGKAFIGGGFGTEEILSRVKQTMDTIDPIWIVGVRKRLGKETADRFRYALETAGIQDYKIIHDSWQLWIIFGKENAQ
ncbi:class I SAM-dependent methyltransferase [Methanogenium marinum]|uniref:Class I SAM-dependent methyltransferase n=1 Tax=Methanogenium marinum TaxID=348610 RepID=A0A9Q4PW07_9EURY|nr:class I SAM-dependent methyltransferase [Methanogenium marinum]MDE4908575.1 class I SAM-dependent methyltransferase [Methanogenium marinum]